jgi:sulfite reductase beta subunit-like hemoprotein
MSQPNDPVPRASFADEREIDELVAMLGRFERRELDAESWRAYRVARGVYSQRQDGVHMLRTKVPQGIATDEQLRALADVATRWSRGFGHLTTRQNFQFHFVRPGDLDAALRRLAAAGITTAGAGGNAVRNVVACPWAGIGTDELFDVTPYAEAMTRHFLRHPLASALPRKFKIAFEGCGDDHVVTPIHDLGFRARVRDGRRGFAVTIAGGTATLCTSGEPLVAFLPAGEILALAEAVVRVFDAHGDRQNRQRNRLKFLVRQLGLAGFRELLDEARAEVEREGGPRLPFDPERAPEEAPPGASRPAPPDVAAIASRVSAARAHTKSDPAGAKALVAFRATNVRAQRQAGYAAVVVAAPQGDLTSAQLEVLADLAAAYGDRRVRFGIDGHVQLRWVSQGDVPALFERLAAAGLGRAGAGGPADVVSCPGSEACRLALTHTRGVAQAINERLCSAGGDAIAAPVRVHVSGCPNGCSQHHVAAIGLQGSVRKVAGRAVPQYFVLVGGGVDDDGAEFGKLAGKVPAQRVAVAVERLVSLFLAERAPAESAGAFFSRAADRATAVLADLAELTPEEVWPEDLVEPGLDGPADSECAA